MNDTRKLQPYATRTEVRAACSLGRAARALRGRRRATPEVNIHAHDGERPPKHRSVRGDDRVGGVVACVFVLSGAAALIYQVAWQRVLLTLYGVQVESVTVVVTAFMLGLGLGSLAGGWLADRPGVDRLRAFIVLETAIGAYGAASIWLLKAVAAITEPAGPGGVFTATFAAVALPTGLMGATLPLLVAHAVRASHNVGRSLSTLYCANTLGGALAAIAVAVVLLRMLGLQGTVWTAASINAAVALGTLALLARRGRDDA